MKILQLNQLQSITEVKINAKIGLFFISSNNKLVSYDECKKKIITTCKLKGAINSKLSVTPKGVYLPISNLHSILI